MPLAESALNLKRYDVGIVPGPTRSFVMGYRAAGGFQPNTTIARIDPAIVPGTVIGRAKKCQQPSLRAGQLRPFYLSTIHAEGSNRGIVRIRKEKSEDADDAKN